MVNENWQAFEAMKKEKKADFLILSSEMVPQLYDHKKFWDRLTDGFNSVQFIFYVRHPMKFYESLINQMIQGGKDLHATFRNPYKMNGLDLALNMYNMCHSNGHPIQIRCFDRKTLINGDVVDDFSFQLSEICGRNINLKKVIRINESLSHEALFGLYVFNKIKGSDINSVDWDARKSIVAGLQELDRDNASAAKKLTFGHPHLEKWLVEGYEEHLEMLTNEYGISFKSPEFAQHQQNQDESTEELLWNEFYSVSKSNLFGEYFSYVMEVIGQEQGS